MTRIFGCSRLQLNRLVHAIDSKNRLVICFLLANAMFTYSRTWRCHANHKWDTWRNGSTSHSISEACVLDSRRVHF